MTPEVEARFAAIESILAATARQQAINTQSITRLEATVAANSESITRLEASIDRTNQNLHDEITNMANALSALASSFDESSRRTELASQVTQAAVERLVDALAERFGGNGHQ